MPRHLRQMAKAFANRGRWRAPELARKIVVIAGTDCGLGGRMHPSLAWAKLEALVAGARLASPQL